MLLDLLVVMLVLKLVVLLVLKWVVLLLNLIVAAVVTSKNENSDISNKCIDTSGNYSCSNNSAINSGNNVIIIIFVIGVGGKAA